MLKQSTLKEIVQGSKLSSVKTVADVKNVLELSVDEFKAVWGLSSTTSDSAPEGTTDIDLQIEYSTEDTESPEDFCTLGINVLNEEMEGNTNFLNWKVNNVILYDFD